MRRLILLMIISCALFSMLIFAARAYGESHPQADELTALGFSGCDSKPCFMGVTPGIRSWDEVKANFTPFTEDNPSTYDTKFRIEDGDNHVSGEFSQGKSRLIEAHFSIREPALASLLGQYGVPCGVTIYPGPTSASSPLVAISLYYNNTVINIDLGQGLPIGQNIPDSYSLSPNMKINGIEIVDVKAESLITEIYQQFNPCHITGDYEMYHVDSNWLGFASVNRYLQYAADHPRNP